MRLTGQSCREQADGCRRIIVDAAAKTTRDVEACDFIGGNAALLHEREQSGTDGRFGQLDLSDVLLGDGYCAVTDDLTFLIFGFQITGVVDVFLLEHDAQSVQNARTAATDSRTVTDRCVGHLIVR